DSALSCRRPGIRKSTLFQYRSNRLDDSRLPFAGSSGFQGIRYLLEKLRGCASLTECNLFCLYVRAYLPVRLEELRPGDCHMVRMGLGILPLRHLLPGRARLG